MLRAAREQSSSVDIPEKLNEGLQTLQEALQYARDLGIDPWEFAVSMSRLEQLRFNPSDLRWLTLKGLAQHAREVTVEGDDGRQFRPTGNLTFCECTCVVLTDFGASLVGSHLAKQSSLSGVIAAPDTNLRLTAKNNPEWKSQSRRLTFNGLEVKRFKWPASNQEAVLCAFQEEDWPERIDDPLRPHPDQDSKRRLADTIKCLNRKQVNNLIHFRGDGTGEGVIWEPRNNDRIGQKL
ncbi:hypothetical protein FF011L_35150 [Roseimaritima multifibrata]|uniref:Uncharacterized protein n=1 Tax=Roseimaritima multifibrata TaxID=1930274 RepID=A0A517MIR1_9BACT|nr:hypothetical protein FF011L_35150 [Roseimaritima multifibrata]